MSVLVGGAEVSVEDQGVGVEVGKFVGSMIGTGVGVGVDFGDDEDGGGGVEIGTLVGPNSFEFVVIIENAAELIGVSMLYKLVSEALGTLIVEAGELEVAWSSGKPKISTPMVETMITSKSCVGMLTLIVAGYWKNVTPDSFTAIPIIRKTIKIIGFVMFFIVHLAACTIA